METGIQCQEPTFKYLSLGNLHLILSTESELKMLVRAMNFVKRSFFILSLYITFFKYMYEVSAKLFSNALILPILNATYLCHEL